MAYQCYWSSVARDDLCPIQVLPYLVIVAKLHQQCPQPETLHLSCSCFISDCVFPELLADGMTFLPLSGMLDPCQPSSNNWKLISFDTTWLHPKFPKKKKKKTCLYLYLFLLLLALSYYLTMPETWYYEHFLCLFASLRWIASCIPQL